MKMMNKFLILLLSALSSPQSQAVVILNDTVVNADYPSSEIGRETYDFDVNNDGRTDWSIIVSLSRFGSNGVNVQAAPTTGFIYQQLSLDDFALIIPLDAGTVIGSSLEDPANIWYHGYGQGLSSWANNQPFGSFYLQEGYLGFEFESDEGTHYGYAYLESLSTERMRISQVAWETEPGKAIQAGYVPEPSSSLLLILSIFMTLVQRKRV
ncbi:MAG: hypothetical protein ACJAVK_002058 [Akkermansiaceae bacterium]|jgi:hypothetical protein